MKVSGSRRSVVIVNPPRAARDGRAIAYLKSLGAFDVAYPSAPPSRAGFERLDIDSLRHDSTTSLNPPVTYPSVRSEPSPTRRGGSPSPKGRGLFPQEFRPSPRGRGWREATGEGSAEFVTVGRACHKRSFVIERAHFGGLLGCSRKRKKPALFQPQELERVLLQDARQDIVRNARQSGLSHDVIDAAHALDRLFGCRERVIRSEK